LTITTQRTLTSTSPVSADDSNAAGGSDNEDGEVELNDEVVKMSNALHPPDEGVTALSLVSLKTMFHVIKTWLARDFNLEIKKSIYYQVVKVKN
jgi:hypothetical protein